MKTKYKQLIALSIASIIILVAKAFLYIPQPYVCDRGIEGYGLYRSLSEIQFAQTLFCTFLLIFLLASIIIKFRIFISIIVSVAFSSINLGLMILDARTHSYLPDIENLIQNLFGSKIVIYLEAFIALLFGAVLLTVVFWRDRPLTRRSS